MSKIVFYLTFLAKEQFFMNLFLINPFIRLATKSIILSGHNIARRIIYDYELIYLEKGEFTLVYADKPYHCKTGDIIFIRPEIPHAFILDRGEISQPHIHFDITHRPQSENIPISFKDLPTMTVDEKNWIHKDYFSSYAPTPIISVNDKDKFLELFYKIISKDTHPILKKALMIEVLSSVISANYQDLLESNSSHNVAHQIRDYLDAGNGLEMSLSDFSKCFFHSKFYLDKKFKECFGSGIIEYRNKKRLDTSNELLRTLSVTEVADRLGYQSIYAFSRAYKNHFGISPRKAKLNK